MKCYICKIFSLVTLILFACFYLSANAQTELLLKKHATRPLQAEANMPALEPWLTPTTGFFVRSHHPVPHINPENFVLVIDGLVDKPLKLTLTDLYKMQQISLYAVLQCSGSGRGLQRPQAPGIQWDRGAVGNAHWTGIPIAEILKLAGVQKKAKYLRLEGADKPALPKVPVFARSILLEKAMAADSILALKMNDEPLPLLQGFPLRAVLPNWYGENWVKWVNPGQEHQSLNS